MSNNNSDIDEAENEEDIQSCNFTAKNNKV